ncbi:MAG: hypothetical protein LBJ07_02515 [Actinomycetes bacterium]|nr:hypothetical protein [Actinomycetes bacterium]
MGAWMSQWLFTYNIPMVMNNFFYTCMVLICVVGVATGVFAALSMKKVEQYLPADEAFEAQHAAKEAAKAKKKGAKD